MIYLLDTDHNSVLQRIASIALANNATLLTRNTHDFVRVPNLRFADWTV